MDLRLANQVALVTGGARGLGRAIALGLGAEGVRVAVNFVRSRARAEQLVEQLRTEHGVAACAVAGDVANSSDVARMLEICEDRLGQLDILINNAGIWPTASVHDITEEDWDRTVAINLKGPFLTSRAALRRWLATGRGGRIVNISSPAAFLGATTGHAHYAAAKAGLVNLTISLAREGARHGIFVNAVAPGMMKTDMTADTLATNESHYLERIPLKRIADPAEVADVVVFLCSERASYTTGATFDVSGGMLMR